MKLNVVGPVCIVVKIGGHFSAKVMGADRGVLGVWGKTFGPASLRKVEIFKLSYVFACGKSLRKHYIHTQYTHIYFISYMLCSNRNAELCGING